MELRAAALATLDLSLGRLRQVPEAAVLAKVASLRDKGQLTPVVAALQDGVLVLIDGFVRHLAATRLGLTTLLVEVVEYTPVQCKAQVYLRNRERGLLLIEECRLVRELAEVDGQSQVEIGELVERHKSWVCRRLAISKNLSPHLWEDAALGQLGEGSLRKLASLPARNQEELVAVAQRDGLRPGQVAALLELWRQASAEARVYLLQHPADAVERARAGLGETVDARLGKRGSEVLRGLLVVRQVCVGIERRLQQGLGEVPPEGNAVLLQAYRGAQRGMAAALGQCETWLGTAAEVGR